MLEVSGSTWTISSQSCTIDLISDVLPVPMFYQSYYDTWGSELHTLIACYEYLDSANALSSVREGPSAGHFDARHNELRGTVHQCRLSLDFILST
jgi:hypothetical protein